ncbi:OmpH family outer membrane protein [Candidatus Clavichlamydia salmonicola]|uniref:OmpH family outer membrane protein n=1 Tax=Candidatus Clavichlamydia salmonicola TaxID=469812 RepID=UPI00189127B1|nr:OmpH family outer membrane protein [Candidatus Clavichlamydia salmonicola]
MKKVFFSCLLLFFSCTGFCANTIDSNLISSVNESVIHCVNLKKCVEESLIGKEEKKQIERVKTRLEQNGQRLEEQLDSLSAKMRDEDYLETLSENALDELKKKLSLLHQEYSACQNQYYQMINQANYAMINKVTEQVRLAVEEIIEKNPSTIVLNSEVFFSATSPYDMTSEVLVIMNQKFQDNLHLSANFNNHGE